MITGSSIADLQCVFDSDWHFATGKNKSKTVKKICRNNTGITQLQIVPSGPDIEGDPLYENILSMLFSAKKRIFIVTPYFIPDEMLVKALCIAAKRGIDIQIVVPRKSNHLIANLARRNFLKQVQDCGAVVHMFEDGMMHGKAILVDDSWAIAGSMNMDMRSFFFNYEIAIYIYDDILVTQLKNWVNSLMQKSTIGINKTTLFGNILEGAVRLFAPLL